MRKVLVLLLAICLMSSAAVAQDQMGLVLTTPGLHALAPGAFQGGIGAVFPMGSFNLRPAVGFDIASQTNGTDRSRSEFDLGVDLLMPFSEGTISTYFGGGIGFGLEKAKEDVMGGETTISTTRFGGRGLFGIACKPLKNLSVATEVYLSFGSETTKTEFKSSSLAKVAAPLESEYKGSYFRLAPAAVFILTFYFNTK